MADRFKMAMMEGALEPRIIFPCDLPNWPSIREQLLALTSCNNPNKLVDKLQYINQQIPKDDLSGSAHSRRGNAFKGLGRFLIEEAGEEERGNFFTKILPCIVHWAAQIDTLKPPQGLPISRQQCPGDHVISRCLAASIVACAFFSIFPYRRADKHSILNTINFENFFCHLGNGAQQAKLRCILHYFERLAELPHGPEGNLIFSRKVIAAEDLARIDDWLSQQCRLCSINVHTTGTIEDSGSKLMHVDFANRKLGGGIVGTGRVQEEIRFSVSPELLCGSLFMEAMDENEAIWVSGFETFSKYTGYARTLRYAGNLFDPAQRDRNYNLENTICAIDALPKASKRQYCEEWILRDLTKLWAGFTPKPRLHGRLEKQRNVMERQASCERSRMHRWVSEEAEPSAAESFSDSLLGLAIQDAWRGLHTHGTLKHSSSSESHSSERFRLRPCDRSDSDSSHDSHALSFDGDSYYRRRSSNLSDLASRRSSDLCSSRRSSDISRRSSGSTRHSSDFSSEFEDYFESFQRQELRRRHDAISEEPGHPVVQEFAGNLVADLFKESSVIVAQMAPGVQRFESIQPPDVTRPTPVKPPSSSPSNVPLDESTSSDSSNQTDDQKIKENISTYVDRLLVNAFQTVQEPTNSHTPRQHSHSTNQRLQVPMTGQSSRRHSDLSLSHRSNTVSLNSSVQINPSLSDHAGESLTDDLKQAVAAGHDFHYSSPSVSSNTHVSSPSFTTIDQFASHLAKSVMRKAFCQLSHRAAMKRHHRTREETRRWLHETQDRAIEFAEGLVTTSIQSAVEEVFGYHQIPVPFSPPKEQVKPHKGRYARGKSDTFFLKRKGSADDVLSLTGKRHVRRNSLDELHRTLRSSSFSFKDTTLSDFADELVRSNPNSPSFAMFEQQISGSRGDLSHRRGSNSSRTSSSDRSPHRGSRRPSVDLHLWASNRSESFQPGNSSSSNNEKGTPSSCKAVLLEFLSRRKPVERNFVKNVGPCHLEWFAEDLLLDIFNDSFITLFGQNYADIIKRLDEYESESDEEEEEEEEEEEVDIEVGSITSPSRNKIEGFVEQLFSGMMSDACQQSDAVDISFNSDITLDDDEDDDESVYEDALDVPYPLIDEMAARISSKVMREALGNVRELRPSPLRQIPPHSRHKKKLQCRPLGKAIATGNWGCGAFGGDPQLKCLLQWIVASVTGVTYVQYYTFDNPHLEQFSLICDRVLVERWTTSKLLHQLLRACQRIREGSSMTVFELLFDEDPIDSDDIPDEAL